MYSGKLIDFDFSRNNAGRNIVEDLNPSDGDEGTDLLGNSINRMFFNGNSSIDNQLELSTVSGIAGVHESTDNSDTSTSISGGPAKATDFIIDVEGEVGLALEFDTEKLGNFVNDVTLDDADRSGLRKNLALDFAAGAFSAIPVVGAAGSTAISMGQTAFNYKEELRANEEQLQRTQEAINNPDYNTDAWITVTETFRDLVVIEDFQIGIDNLFLPSVAQVEAANVGYAMKSGILNGRNGVFIEAQIDNENSNLVFIVDNYQTLNNAQFAEEMTNLVTGRGVSTTDQATGEVTTDFSGAMIGTFNQTPIRVEPLQSGLNVQFGSNGGDHIFGAQLGGRNTPGAFELVGGFGDDLIQGSTENDFLNGGFNSSAPTFSAFTYENDGSDVLQGGKGDDQLRGGSGNDILDGGGFTYGENIEVTGVIRDDGADTLIGGSGSDTFAFNTLSTGIDIIEDFEVSIDTIQIDKVEFGATDNSEFSWEQRKKVGSGK